MKYTVYKTTNKTNGKFYIGKHKTENPNDDYLGSGKYLNLAIKRYGIENFSKEVLFIFNTEEEMNAKEAELVTEEFCQRKDTYNICTGGRGGWSYINSNRLNLTDKHKQSSRNNLNKARIKFVELLKTDKEFLESHLSRVSYLRNYGFGNRKHSEESLNKMRNADRTGRKNSSFGSCWVFNEIHSIRIKKDDLDQYLEQGYIKGRKLKF